MTNKTKRNRKRLIFFKKKQTKKRNPKNKVVFKSEKPDINTYSYRLINTYESNDIISKLKKNCVISSLHKKNNTPK